MRGYLICLTFIVMGVLCLLVDVPLALWLMDGGLPADLRALFQRVEVFGHAYGLICIAITIYVLDPGKRRQLVSLVISFVAAGLTADALKLMVWRTRPRAYLEQLQGGSTFVGSVWTHFDRAAATVTDHAFHSFPSAHTACAVALAFQLSRTYPAGRNWFFILAALCAMNRIDGGAHFASDVCCGAAVGCAVSRVLADVRFSVPVVWRRMADRTAVDL